MNVPSPAIVAQDGVRRLPRWGLLLFCAVYVLAGFVGRDPWKRLDVTSYGYMLDMAYGTAPWLAPGLLGETAGFNALLPYWLGAAAIRLGDGWLPPFLAVRLVFIAMLALTLLATWHAMYYLARSPRAQPVAFAFGGQARPKDYAHAIADGGLLALLACLGLAQAAHEVSPELAQLCFTSCVLYALAAAPYHRAAPLVLGGLGMLGLTLSGAPGLAMLFMLWGLVLHGLDSAEWQRVYLAAATPTAIGSPAHVAQQAVARHRHRLVLVGLAAGALVCAWLASHLQLWRWRIDPLPGRWVEWRNLGRMALWMLWPAWLLTLWTLWRWRRQWCALRPALHLALPGGMALICSVAATITSRSSTSLLLALPAFAALAAFALPTLRRSASALIDWFSMIFFSLVAAYLWLMWVAMQTGVPASPARLALRRVPGYVPDSNWLPLLAGIVVTIGWVAMVRWRTRRLRPAIWKSMILPAGGITLCWALLTTVWLPPLNYARSYNTMNAQVFRTLQTQPVPADGCVMVYGLDDAQISALLHHAGQQGIPLPLTRDRSREASCTWLLVNQRQHDILEHVFDMAQWQLQATAHRATDPDEVVAVYRRGK